MLEKEIAVPPPEPEPGQGRSLAVGITSFLFILLQSACTAFMAISGLRLLIGVGSLAAATVGFRFMAAIHGAAIRIPMETIAVAGSAINLYAVWRVRRLRVRPASQWRMRPVTPKQLRSETWQVCLAVLTLILVGMEWGFHFYLHGTV